MPPSYTTAQKAAIQNFMSFTQSDRATAARILKANNWNTEHAVNGYFTSSNASAANRPLENTLNKLFDKYREAGAQDADTIGIDGTMSYLSDLGVGLDEISMLVVMEVVQSPTMGEITRKGFVSGWSAQNTDTLDKQRTHISQICAMLPQPTPASRTALKQVHKHTFTIARPTGQKAIPLDQAIEYWRLIFSASGLNWHTPASPPSIPESRPWFDWWVEFLESNWKKTVNKDMWDQLFGFAEMTLKEGGLGFWSEDGAWPAVVDEFVEWCGTEKGVKGKVEEDEDMEY
ncbi:DUF298 domain protein [Saccharata proteae CBS 121410]|uniref:Defective in cullin neddylation protein n=1 Tax=Saccharata proteae CBS 121410 TaxID=1314787 RepID=A0A9P4HYG6_9PEZI|nr:DUF298 domain protein [Saccharata proteae CBS 121410]